MKESRGALVSDSPRSMRNNESRLSSVAAGGHEIATNSRWGGVWRWVPPKQGRDSIDS
jgi:hypothetical protein